MKLRKFKETTAGFPTDIRKRIHQIAKHITEKQGSEEINIIQAMKLYFFGETLWLLEWTKRKISNESKKGKDKDDLTPHYETMLNAINTANELLK